MSVAFITTMRGKTAFCAIVIFFAFLLAAVQASAQAEDSPITKLEEFNAKIGSAIMVGYSEVGTIRGKHGTNVDVNAKEIVDASALERVSGITITVRNYTTLGENSHSSFIDEDEIASLLEGLNYISNAKKDHTKFDRFEALYSTRDDLTISVHNDEKGKVSLVVASGKIGREQAYLKVEDLSKLIGIIVKARDML